MGAAVTFLLVFRVNTGYERWWEGRRTFREVVNHSRDFARQCATHVSDFYLAEKMIRWVMVSVLMLKQHLREETFVDEVSVQDSLAQDVAENLCSLCLEQLHLMLPGSCTSSNLQSSMHQDSMQQVWPAHAFTIVMSQKRHGS